MCPNARKENATKAVELFGGQFIHLTYAASALISGEDGLAVLRMTIFKDIETSIKDLPLKVKKNFDSCGAKYCAITNKDDNHR